MKDYEQVLSWCNVFLLGNSFAPSKGHDVALSLLFDMNVLFEAYVGHYLRKHCSSAVSLQDKGHHLACQDNKGVFALRPDIVIDGGKTIADTKWKVLSEDKGYQDISQSDVYQMYAYATKYKDCQRIALIYPKIGDSKVNSSYFFKSIQCDTDGHKNIPLNILFFDLSQPDKQTSEHRIDVAYFQAAILPKLG
jgi:5-methylcytosine-specific restriction enzyme subunit McrC